MVFEMQPRPQGRGCRFFFKMEAAIFETGRHLKKLTEKLPVVFFFSMGIPSVMAHDRDVYIAF